MYFVHDLNSLDAYTSCTVHEQDLVVAWYKRVNYMHAIAHVHSMICAYIACVQLVNISQSFLSNLTSIHVRMSSLI